MDSSIQAPFYEKGNISLGFSFYLLVFYLIIEYARPPFISVLRPALILQIVLFFFLLGRREKVAQIVKDKFFKLYIFLLFFMVFHVFFAVNNYWAFMQFQALFTYFLVGISFCVILDSVEKINSFFKIFILIMVVCAIDRISGFHIFGGSGPMGDENDFAMAMNASLPLSFFLARNETGKWKFLFWTASCLFVIGNMVSASRGGFLSLVVVGSACFAYSRHKLMAIFALILFGVIAWTFASPEFRQEVLEIGAESADTDTGKDRIELWKVAWRAFLDNPITGVGQGNMPIVIEKYQYDSEGHSFWERGLWGRAVHSVYFTLLPELGIIGMIIFGLMLKDIVNKHRKIKRLYENNQIAHASNVIENANIAVIVSILSFLSGGIFLSAFYYPEYWNFSTLLTALFFASSRSASSL